MATEQQTSPAGETCRCGRAMVNTTIYADEGMLRWRCPHCREIRHRPMPPDALAGALAEREWLRGALFAITKADDLEEAVMIANAALAPQHAEKQARNRAESGSGRPEGPKRANGAGVPATGRNTEGIER
jgi:hypothetical protein